MDLIGLFLDDVERIRAKVPGADVVVASMHDHEGPDTMGLWGPAMGQSGINEDYNSFVVDRVAEAARGAVHALQPATPVLARVHAAELDSFIHDDRPPVVHAPDLIVLSLTGKDGKVYQRRSAFCMEPQYYPDSPNHSNFPSTELKPGQTYHCAIEYKFSVQ